MSKNDMVMVPRELAQYIADGGYCWPDAMEKLEAILARPAQQHQGEPVGMLRGSRRVCHCCVGMDREEWCSICDSAAGTEVERLRGELDKALEFVERLRDERETLQTQLAEAQALLREVLGFIDDGVGRSDAEWSVIQKARTAISASAEPKCGRCHGRGLLRIATVCGPAYKVCPDCASAEPSAPKCGNCTASTGNSCNENGCGYLEGGNGAPSTPVEIDERAEFEAHMLRDFPGVYLTRALDRESYRNPSHQGAWLSWQARAALARKL